MVAFPGMLIGPAQRANIKVPDDPNNYDENEYPHFFVFCQMQLGRSMPNPTSHWNNAAIIAKISDDEIRRVSYNDIINMGFE